MIFMVLSKVMILDKLCRYTYGNQRTMTKKHKRTPKLGRVQRRLRAVGRVVLSGEHIYTKAGWGPNVDQASPECVAEYLQILEDWELRDRKPRTVSRTAGQPTTLGALCDVWVAHLQALGRYQHKGVETSSWAYIRSSVKTFKKSFGNVQLSLFSRTHLVRYRDEQEALVAECKHLPHNANRKIRKLREFISWCVQRDYLRYVLATVADNLPIVKAHHHQDVVAARKHRKRAVSWDDVNQLAAACNDVYGDMFKVHRTVGCRPGELCAMHVDEIKVLDDGWWTWSPSSHKTQHKGAKLTYWLHEDAQRLLEPWVAKARKGRGWVFNYKETGCAGNRKYQTSCKDLSGPISLAAYRRALDDGCQKSGVERFTPHELRHAVASERANDPRLSLSAAGRSIGHSSITSLQSYVHPDEDEIRRASKAR